MPFLTNTLALLALLPVSLCLTFPSTPPSKTLNSRSSTCTPTPGNSPSTDDVPAIQSALSTCGNGGTIIFPTGKTYYLNSVLDLSACNNCDIQVEGLLKFTSDTDYWGGRTAMINVDGVSGMKMSSVSGDGGIDGNGQDAYDRFASDSSYSRPTLFYITDSSSIHITSLRLKNPPNVFISVKGSSSNLTFSSLRMDTTSKSSNPAKNTDGFDIGSRTNVVISDVSVTNDDDCVAFKTGADGVTVSDITCIGSHGLSVGSLGKSSDDIVKNIYISGATMVNCTKAAGIKTYPSGGSHGHSTVSNVTWTGVVVEGGDYAIQIQSCYGESESWCEAYPGDAELSGILFEGFSGTTSGRYGSVTGDLDCGKDGRCGVLVSGYIVMAPGGGSEVVCANTEGDLGVECTAGAAG